MHSRNRRAFHLDILKITKEIFMLKTKFTKAIALAAALIMAQSTALTAAAETVTGSLSAVRFYALEEEKSKYNDNVGYTALDKWGHSYPYSYYIYAEKALEKGKEDALEAYIAVYNALHETRGADGKTLVVYVPELKGKVEYSEDKIYSLYSMAMYITRECPDLYYASNYGMLYTEKAEDGRIAINVPLLFTKTEIEKYDKSCTAALNEFNAKLSGVSSSDAFYHAALDFIVKDYGINYVDDSGVADTAAGAFANKKVCCMGYTEAFNYLCQMNGMPFASVVGKLGNYGHSMSKVPIKNVWYVVDPTNAGYFPQYSFVTDTAYTSGTGIKEISYSGYSTVPANGTAIFPDLSAVGRSSDEFFKTDEKDSKEDKNSSEKKTSAKTDNSKKNTSVTIQSTSLKSYTAFKKALKSAVKKAKDGGYGYLTLKTSSVKTLEKYLKKAKKDEVISYKSIKVNKDSIRIRF